MNATALNLETAISPEQRALLQHAAEKQGRNLTDFVIAAVLEVLELCLCIQLVITKANTTIFLTADQFLNYCHFFILLVFSGLMIFLFLIYLS